MEQCVTSVFGTVEKRVHTNALKIAIYVFCRSTRVMLGMLMAVAVCGIRTYLIMNPNEQDAIE